MKIIIAGPVPDKKKSGGVAVFNKNLAIQLAGNKANKVLIATNKPKQVNEKDVYPDNVLFANIFNIYELKNFNADVIISSLWYSLFFCYGFRNAIKIHTIHAFPDFISYKTWKFNVMHIIDKILRNKFNYLVANSKFTRYLYESFFNISIDGLYTIGLDSNVIAFLKEKNKRQLKKEKNILYIGRIVKEKHLDKALEAISHLSTDKYEKFNIWGYGIEEEKLKQEYEDNSKIIFHGAINHYDVYKAYQNNKVFISLNPAEPFGITYEEAIANGLYVVAPNTGGCVDFLKQYPDRCSLVDTNDLDSIINGLLKGLCSNLKPLGNNKLDKLSYANTKNQIFEVIKNDINYNHSNL